MSLVEEGYQVFRSRLRRPEISSLCRDLMSARSKWLLQASNWVSQQGAREKSADMLDLAYAQQWAFDEVIAQQASAKLWHVDRALDHMLEASYGVCRGCRNDIPLSRLRFLPQTVLCTACIEERLDQLSAEAL
ncbi:MAG: TraR/DksA C4-type zinc finger protein [Nitrospira sp.]|nr:TraR/DksA C4-type zinc finger protein [Nitrospira sp.]